MAARSIGGAAHNLVAAAGHAAGAAPHCLSGDLVIARAGAARGDTRPDALVVDPAAHVAGRAGDLGGSHPLLNPQTRLASTGPIVLVIDDGWAAARDWPTRQAALVEFLAEAEREDRQM